jgi:23S rRNA (uracil1939-C5)-methyltransferase
VGDRARLGEFARQQGFDILLQSGGPETVEVLFPAESELYLRPDIDSDIRIGFNALDFVQVNRDINRQMVAQAIRLLDLQPTVRTLDLFCGLGNFTLPMARRCARVTGVEVDAAMLARARTAATANHIDNTEYYCADLSHPDVDAVWMRQQYDCILLDPPRSGALEMAQSIDRFQATRIVYVSCQPSSLVRDTAIICAQGYRLSHLGVMDMFPQTAHVEAMAVFDRETRGSR